MQRDFTERIHKLDVTVEKHTELIEGLADTDTRLAHCMKDTVDQVNRSFATLTEQSNSWGAAMNLLIVDLQNRVKMLEARINTEKP